jgi:hypothetical protein
VKTLYAFALALLVVSGFMLALPPPSTVAANCAADCRTGEVINIKEVSFCSCMDDVGCAWTRAGKSYAKRCSEAEVCVAGVRLK